MAAKKKRKVVRKRKAPRKASTKAKRSTMPPNTVLFNCRLLKPVLAKAKAKARQHFRGNMSALARVALVEWQPKKRRAR